MGYRLHYAQHYDPAWEGGFFNRDLDKWDNLFHERFEFNGWKEEGQDDYQVLRADVQDYVNELQGKDPEAFNQYFTNDDADKDQPNGYTNAQIIEVLESILTSDDDDIHLTCF